MAIACEVATKELFAKKGKRAGSNIPVALHTGAKKAFGASFYHDHRKDWHHIDSTLAIFARNQIAGKWQSDEGLIAAALEAE